MMAQVWRLRALVVLVGYVLLVTAGFGQQTTFADVQQRWDQTASRAEAVLSEASASNKALLILRKEIATQRAEAQEYADRGSIEVRSLQVQLDALGPTPTDADKEPAALANQRADLRERLVAANAPVLAAQQAYQRAELLIQEIDGLIRSRTTTELLSRGPTPLSPNTWIAAVGELWAYGNRVSTDIRRWFVTAMQAGTIEAKAPIAIVLMLLGLGILLVGFPGVQSRLETFLTASPERASSALSGFVAGAARLVVPLVGGFLIAIGFLTLEINAFSARTLLSVVPILPFFLVVPSFIGHLIFAPTLPDQRLVSMDDQLARQGSRLANLLGLVLVAQLLLEAAETDFSFSADARSAMTATLIVVGGYLLFLLSRVLQKANEGEEEEDTTKLEDGHASILGLIARLVQVAAVVAVICVLAGYIDLARKTMVPTILSLGLIGVALAVHRLLVSIAGQFVGEKQKEEESLFSLFPVLLGVMVILAALPVLALIWGAQSTDIVEMWILASQGVVIGGVRISINVVIALVLVFAIGLFMTRWIQAIFRTNILPRTKMDSGGKTAIVTGIGYAGISLSSVVAVTAAGLDLSNLAIVAGALSVGIGFGLQAVVSNFVSGIILLIERPVKQGDWIEVSGYSGIVRKIAVRATRIETFDRHDVIIPNADLISGAVKNMTLSSKSGRVTVPIGVAYGSDVEKVRQILLAATTHQPIIMTNPEPQVLFMDMGESSLNFELRCFVRDVNSGMAVKSELLFEIYAELGKAGIEIPYPHRDISVRNLSVLADAISGTLGQAKPNAKPKAATPRRTPKAKPAG